MQWFFFFFSLFQKYFPFLFRGFTPLLKNPPYEGTSFEVSGLQTHRNNPPVHALCAISVFEAEAHHNLWCWRYPTQGDEVTPAVSLMTLESLMACRCLSHRRGSQVQGLAKKAFLTSSFRSALSEPILCHSAAAPSASLSLLFCSFFMVACFSAGSSAISEATDSAFFSSSQGSRQNKPIWSWARRSQ